MSERTDTKELAARPGCCERGDTHIRIQEPHALHGPDTKGWALALHGQYDLLRENIEFCPWCGKSLP